MFAPFSAMLEGFTYVTLMCPNSRPSDIAQAMLLGRTRGPQQCFEGESLLSASAYFAQVSLCSPSVCPSHAVAIIGGNAGGLACIAQGGEGIAMRWGHDGSLIMHQ